MVSCPGYRHVVAIKKIMTHLQILRNAPRNVNTNENGRVRVCRETRCKLQGGMIPRMKGNETPSRPHYRSRLPCANGLAFYLRAGAPSDRPCAMIRHLIPRLLCLPASPVVDAKTGLDMGFDRYPEAEVSFRGDKAGCLPTCLPPVQKSERTSAQESQF